MRTQVQIPSWRLDGSVILASDVTTQGNTVNVPFVDWTGPRIGTSGNLGSVVQLMANDPTTFVEKPLKQDGSYDIARSADLHWHAGIAQLIQNPLTEDFAIVKTATLSGVAPAMMGIIDRSVSPQIICMSGVSAQGNLNLRTHCLLEVEPEIGSAFMPWKGFPPSGGAKATEFLKAFCSIANTAAHTFGASMNDTGALGAVVKDMVSKTKQQTGVHPPASPNQGGAWGAANNAITGYFAGSQVRNQRKSEVRTNKADNKTARKVAKQQTKQAKANARRK